MKIKLLSTALIALLLFGASCKKSEDTNLTEETSIDNIKVSSSFDWNTTNEINFSIGTSDARFQNLIHVIYIYDIAPEKGGKILAKGSATLISPFNTKIAFASATKSVYVVKSAPNGTKIGQEILLTSKNINLSFNSAAVSQLGGTTKQINNLVATTGTPTVPACGRSTTNGNITVSGGEVVCYSATTDQTIDIQDNTGGGTIKISAPGRKITIRNFNQNNGVNIVVDANTTVAINGQEIRANQSWINNGTLEFSGKLTLKGTLTTNGTLKVPNMEIMAAGTLNNFGTLTATAKVDIAGTLNNNNSATFTELTLNSSSLVNNYCKLFANSIMSNSVINNYSYILSRDSYTSNSGAKVNMIGSSVSGAYFETAKINKGSNAVYFEGTNATSIVKATSIDNNLVNETSSPGRPIMIGTINLWSNTTVSANFFTAPATTGTGAYVEKNDCMPVANGTAPTPVVTDTDGDGVQDKDDDFPTDKSKAYKNYSINYANGGSTLAFEDNWPTKGDYDLNDVVITYRYIVVTNSVNQVVEINAGYKLIATGADYINGAGIEFPLAAGKAKIISQTNGSYLESGQDNVVLILFDNSRKLQPTGNTVVGKPESPAVDFNIVLEITDGPELKNFGTVVYNPFIWNATNGFGRGYETHLFGKTPTKLANKDLFDTKDDFSKSNNKYYSTKENLPWVIEVPIAKFAYPIEGAKVDKAYTNFSNWATSNGTSSEEWYSTLSGGANASFIYPVK